MEANLSIRDTETPSLVGCGFLVARFGVFLREIAATTHPSPETPGISL